MKKNLTDKLLIIFIIILIAVLIVLLILPANRDNSSPEGLQTTTTHIHNYGEWIVEETSTCTAKGLMSRACSCGEKDTMIIAALEHNFTEWKLVIAPTCDKEGIEERTCYSCDFSETRYIDAIDHTVDSWTIVNNQKHYLCINCGISVQTEQLKFSNGLTITNKKIMSIGSCTDSEIVIPSIVNNSSVTIIGEEAFELTGIISVIFPETITTVEKSAFNKCLKLETVYLGNNVSQIDSKAFFNCQSLKTITLPDSLELIGEEAFAYCSELKTVYIGSSIDTLEYGVFKHCKELTEIYFNGTIQEWNNISKSDEWDFNTGNYTVYCTNGDIEK